MAENSEKSVTKRKQLTNVNHTNEFCLKKKTNTYNYLAKNQAPSQRTQSGMTGQANFERSSPSINQTNKKKKGEKT
jgi:hypothetical protein